MALDGQAQSVAAVPSPDLRAWFSLRNTLIIFIALRVLITLVAFWANAWQNSVDSYLLNDSWWYASIADDGYQVPAGDLAVVQSEYAFFPMLPALMRIPMVFGIDAFWSGVVVSSAASVFAAWGIFRIGEYIGGRVAGFYFATLFAVWPFASIAFSLPLTEALFVAFAAWAIVFTLRNQLLAAALMACLAGLTRATALAVIAVVIWAAAASIIKRENIAKSLAAVAISVSGIAAFFAFVSISLGSPLAYFDVQKAWHSGFDFGAGWATEVGDWFRGAAPATPGTWFTAVIAVVSVGLFIALLVMRLPVPIVVYSAVAMISVFAFSLPHIQTPRLALPLFTLIIPIAVVLSRCRVAVSVAVLSLLTALACLTGAYIVTHPAVDLISPRTHPHTLPTSQ